MKINIITLGCSKNTVDSENLAASLKQRGHSVTFEATQSDCDATIINTCGFINDAKEESIETILQQTAIAHRHSKPRRIIAVGCLVERYRVDLEKEIPEVDAWFGSHQWEQVSNYIASLEPSSRSSKITHRPLSTPSHYAYIKIAEGCNRSCSYCAIPLIRGVHRSRPIEDIVSEAKSLVAAGVKELIIISQDTTYYGLDLYHKRSLASLLERLATESGAEWIRLHYTYPSSFPVDAIDVIRRHQNICNYIDIPLQHINSRILSSMQRGIDRDGTLRLLNHFRTALPNVAIRTTLIVGYPGETEQEFAELMDFVRTAKFDRMGCFAYSPEEGTPAESLSDTVSQEEKQHRIDTLMQLQQQISLELNQRRIGQTYRCLIDQVATDYIVARTEFDSPEVDNEVIAPISSIDLSSSHLHPGDFVNILITEAFEYELHGLIIP